MDSFWQDTRYGLRRLTRSPGFTTVALFTLALGIGANSAIFSVVHAVILQPLPYKDADRVVGLYHLYDGARSSMSGPNFTDVAAASTTLQAAAAHRNVRPTLTGQGEPVRLEGAEVSASLFDILGVAAVHGRTFRAEENRPGSERVVVLAHSLWRQRFGGEPTIIGRSIQLDGASHEVVGVMPEGFSFPEGREIWRPIAYTEGFTTRQRSNWHLRAIARVRPGVTIEQARAEVETIGRQLAAKYPEHNEGLDITVVQLQEALVGDVKTAFWVLLGAVGFVLLIACVNVANLLLARALAREPELAVRTALGASQGRLVRQMLTESVMLAIAGGALGLLLAVWGVEALLALEPANVPRLQEVRVSPPVILFTAAVSLLTGLLFGLVPAFRSTRAGVGRSLKEGGRGNVSTRGATRVRGALVVVEVALAVTLLAGAGLMIRSFGRLNAVHPGFDAKPALTFAVSLPDARYEDDARQVAFFDTLLPKLEAIPGVTAASAVLALPLSGTSIVLSFDVEGRPPVPAAENPAMQVRIATSGYFDSIGIPLLKGRLFDADDRPGSSPVVVITEAAARQHFPGEDPIGKRIRLGWRNAAGRFAGGEIVGVVGNTKEESLAEPEPPQIYLPYQQWPYPSMTVVLTSSVPPMSLVEQVRREVHALDPLLPVSNTRTLEQVVFRSTSQPRFYTTLLSVFAGVALVLAAIGIFGVLSYAVAQRTKEIGIRIALGARHRSVLGLVARDAMLMATVGLLAGLAAAYLLTEWLVSMLLFETSPHDPVTFSAVAAVLIVVALAAAVIPARRASRVDPIVALRAE